MECPNLLDEFDVDEMVGTQLVGMYSLEGKRCSQFVDRSNEQAVHRT